MSRTEEKRAAFSLAPWKRLWQSIRQHRLRLTVAIGSNLLLAVADFYIPLLQSKVVDQFILAGTTAGFSGYAAKYIGVCAFEIIMLFISNCYNYGNKLVEPTIRYIQQAAGLPLTGTEKAAWVVTQLKADFPEIAVDFLKTVVEASYDQWKATNVK